MSDKSKNILHQFSQIISQDYGHFVGGDFILTEGQAFIKLKKHGKLFYCNFDKSQVKNSPELFPYFTNIKGLKSINDYILFYQYHDILAVFIIELKSSNAKGSLKQIVAGKIFAKFLTDTFKRVYGYWQLKTYFLGLIFTDKSLTKPTTKPFKYIPSSLHQEQLNFFVLHNSGQYIIDKLLQASMNNG